MDRFPGRKRPLEVHFCQPGEPCPRYVSHIEKSNIVLRNGSIAELDRIEFAYRSNPLKNEDLYSKLVNLNQNNIPFAYNPKEMASPDWLMMGWQEAGKLVESFQIISWSDQQTWSITTIEPPIAGLRGWANST